MEDLSRNTNTKENSCNQALKYSFSNCIKSYCKKKWDKLKCLISLYVPPSELLNHSMEYLKLQGLERELVEYTGCLLPCQYNEFRLVDTHMNGILNGPSLVIMFGSKNVLQEKEQEMFPFGAFVAECGGCLGLFLGFFLMFYDKMVILVKKVKKLLNYFL